MDHDRCENFFVWSVKYFAKTSSLLASYFLAAWNLWGIAWNHERVFGGSAGSAFAVMKIELVSASLNTGIDCSETLSLRWHWLCTTLTTYKRGNCPLASKQHLYQNPFQRHQRFTRGPLLLNISIRMETFVSNMLITAKAKSSLKAIRLLLLKLGVLFCKI